MQLEEWNDASVHSKPNVRYSLLIPLTSEHKGVPLSGTQKMMYKDTAMSSLALQVFDRQQKKCPGNQIADKLCYAHVRLSTKRFSHRVTLQTFAQQLLLSCRISFD